MAAAWKASESRELIGSIIGRSGATMRAEIHPGGSRGRDLPDIGLPVQTYPFFMEA